MKYERIIEYIEQQIRSGQIKAGQKLPSIRELSKIFDFNKDTVIRAYHELELNHMIYAIPKSGYYLVEQRKLAGSEETKAIDFKTTLPDYRLLPYKEFNHCINKAIESHKQELFSYGQVEGLSSLREELVKLFWDQQVFVSKEEIFVTTGAQQALSILVKIPFPNGKKNILVEQPTYDVIQRFTELNQGNLVGIRRSCEGVDLLKLESLFAKQNIKFFYTIPRFHNPLGVSYSNTQKKKIVELANKYDVYIVEDDYLGDLELSSKKLTLHYYDTFDHVIYVKSFSKSFMPGIRLGVVTLPGSIHETFIEHKRYDDLNTSILSQGGLEIFLKSGMYRNHLKKVRNEYRNKMIYAKACFKATRLIDTEYYVPDTGFYIWVKLPRIINTRILASSLLQRNISIMTANNFYINKRPLENGFRLCIAALSKAEIQEGVYIIAEEIKTMSKG